MDGYKFELEMGATVTESITAFTGIIVGRYEQRAANDRYLVRSETLSPQTGEPVEVWFNDNEIALKGSV